MTARLPIDEQRFQAIREQFNQPVSPVGLLALTAGIVGLIVLLVYVQRREQRQRRRRSPMAEHYHLFAQVLRTLPLTFRQRRRLKRVARELQLRMPTAILLSPAHLQAAVDRWARSNGQRSRAREGWDVVEQALFDDAEGSSAAPPP